MKKTLLFSWLLLGAAPWVAVVAHAQTYTLTCQVHGEISDGNSMKLKPAKITAGIQTIGNNIFIKVQGPEVYQMFVSSLSTEQMASKNMTSDDSMWVHTRKKSNNYESDIKIAREPVSITAYNDIDFKGHKARVTLEGPCQLPK